MKNIQFQTQITSLIAAIALWKEGEKDPDWVRRDSGGRFAKKEGAVASLESPVDDNSLSPQQERKLTKLIFDKKEIKKSFEHLADLFNEDKAQADLFKQLGDDSIIAKALQEPTLKGKIKSLQTGIKDSIQGIKDDPANSPHILASATRAIGVLGLFLIRAVGPDAVIAAAMMPVPILLAEVGATALVRTAFYATESFHFIPREAIRLEISLVASDMVQLATQFVDLQTFGNTGAAMTAAIGKRASDLLSSAKELEAVIEDLKSEKQKGIENKHYDRLMVALTAPNESQSPATRDFFHGYAARMADKVHGLTEEGGRLTAHAEKRLKAIPNLKESLEIHGINEQELAQRIAEMADLKNVHPPLRLHKEMDFRRFIKRIEEMAESDRKNASGETAKYVEKKKIEADKIDKSVDQKMKNTGGTATKDIIEDVYNYTQIDSDIKKAQNAANWRASAIKKEIQYGEKLDAFMSQQDSEGIKKAYDGFLGSLVKHKKSILNIPNLSDKQIAERVENLRKSQGGDSAMTRPFTNRKEIIDLHKQSNARVLDLFGTLINQPLDVDVFSYSQRGYTATPEKDSKFRTYIDVNAQGSFTIFHELSHAIEAKQPQKHDEAISFRESRASRFAPSRINLAFQGMPGEMAKVTDFSQLYNGKIYPLNSGTEVYSTGIQHLATAKTLYKEAYQDREHLMFSLNILD